MAFLSETLKGLMSVGMKGRTWGELLDRARAAWMDDMMDDVTEWKPGMMMVVSLGEKWACLMGTTMEQWMATRKAVSMGSMLADSKDSVTCGEKDKQMAVTMVVTTESSMDCMHGWDGTRVDQLVDSTGAWTAKCPDVQKAVTKVALMDG